MGTKWLNVRALTLSNFSQGWACLVKVSQALSNQRKNELIACVQKTCEKLSQIRIKAGQAIISRKSSHGKTGSLAIF
jgi:hypothetical protein